MRQSACRNAVRMTTKRGPAHMSRIRESHVVKQNLDSAAAGRGSCRLTLKVEIQIASARLRQERGVDFNITASGLEVNELDGLINVIDT